MRNLKTESSAGILKTSVSFEYDKRQFDGISTKPTAADIKVKAGYVHSFDKNPDETGVQLSFEGSGIKDALRI